MSKIIVKNIPDEMVESGLLTLLQIKGIVLI